MPAPSISLPVGHLDFVVIALDSWSRMIRSQSYIESDDRAIRCHRSGNPAKHTLLVGHRARRCHTSMCTGSHDRDRVAIRFE